MMHEEMTVFTFLTCLKIFISLFCGAYMSTLSFPEKGVRNIHLGVLISINYIHFLVLPFHPDHVVYFFCFI